MLNAIRYKIANYYLKKADKILQKDGIKNNKKVFKYLKKSIKFVPPSKELSNLGKVWTEKLNHEKRKMETL